MKASIILCCIGAVLYCLFFGNPKTRKLCIGITSVMFILLALLCAGCNSHGTSDSLGGQFPSTDAIRARVDPITGCEYITYRKGGITPRMGADGKQICREVAK